MGMTKTHDWSRNTLRRLKSNWGRSGRLILMLKCWEYRVQGSSSKISIKIKSEKKIVPLHHFKAHTGSGDLAPLIRNLNNI